MQVGQGNEKSGKWEASGIHQENEKYINWKNENSDFENANEWNGKMKIVILKTKMKKMNMKSAQNRKGNGKMKNVVRKDRKWENWEMKK